MAQKVLVDCLRNYGSEVTGGLGASADEGQQHYHSNRESGLKMIGLEIDKVIL